MFAATCSALCVKPDNDFLYLEKLKDAGARVTAVYVSDYSANPVLLMGV